MQQHEKRRKRGCDHEEVGLVLSCPILSFGSRHRDRLGWETLFDTIGQVNKARPGSRAHFIFSGSIPDRASQLIDLSPGRKQQEQQTERSEKAYDRLSWDFLEETFCQVGFPSSLVNLIMFCVRSPSMSLIWNGEVTDSFAPQSGLLGGDPLLPYLFVLCIERLANLIYHEVRRKNGSPIKAKNLLLLIYSSLMIFFFF